MSVWYVVHCKSGCDGEAMENLARQGYEVYRPTLSRNVRRGTKKSIESYSMFPRYLFVRSRFSAINSMSINSTRGVNRLVAFAGVNGVVSDSDMEKVRAAEMDMRACIQEQRSAERQVVKLKFSRFSDIPRDILSWSEERRVIFLLQAMQSTYGGAKSAQNGRINSVC